MILISHNIIDVYKFDDSIITLMSQMAPHKLRETIEPVFYNKYNQNKALDKP